MAVAASIAFVANTNALLLNGLVSEAENNTFINDATVTVTVKDSTGASVNGADWPMAMDYVAASNGNYRVGLPAALTLLNGKKYTAVIDADGSDSNFERIGHWEFPFTAQTRTS